VTAKRRVALLLVAPAAYFGLIGHRRIYPLGGDDAALKVFGIAVLVLPPVGVWVVIAADARFGRRRGEVEAQPDDWRRWYRLALANDDAGDRRRARTAMRTAIERSA
jgi:predicted alpha/beta hydrolase